MQEIRNPYSWYAGLDGLAIEMGSIYIGLENQDPETSPKEVFWDADGLVSATQPIRTLAGYPDSDGTPGQLFTSGKYSIRVRDALGNQVFYLASAGSLENTNAGDPYHVHGQFLGDAPGVQATVCMHVFGTAVSFEADLPDAAYLHANTLPASNCVLTMAKNGVPYGTWTVDTTGDSTIDCDQQDFDVGDWFELITPASATAMANFALTMIGTAA
jgi:hypothetical protein